MTEEKILEVKLKLFKDNIYYSVYQGNKEREDYFIHLFKELFDTMPYTYILNNNMDRVESRNFENIEYISEIDVLKTLKNVVKSYPGCYIEQTNLCILYIVTDSFIIDDHRILSKKELDPKLKDCIVTYKNANSIYLVTYNSNYFEKIPLRIKDMSSISENYNEDLPDKRIKEILSEDNSSILLFHGIPGSGKTSYIRSLINTCENLNFYFLDSSVLQYINNTAFIEFITSTKNSVYILEDCENLLKSRDTDFNPLLATLLNISDGLLGDSLNIKFICTFNTNIQNIDKALLRKGRLKLKYEFKELTKDRVANLFKKLNINSPAKEMPLCDVYNYTENNGNSENKKKIGF